MKVPPTIEEMALKHISRHPNDKSEGMLSRMNRRFGRKATDEAIEKMIQAAKLMNMPVNHGVNKPPVFKLSGTATGRHRGSHPLRMQSLTKRLTESKGMYGFSQKALNHITFFDEYTDVDPIVQKTLQEYYANRKDMFDAFTTPQTALLQGT